MPNNEDKELKQFEDNIRIVNDSLGQVFSSFNNVSKGALKGENPLSFAYLDERHYNYLYERARIFQNMVNLIPEDANLEYPVINFEGDEARAKKLQQQLEDIPAIGEPLEQIDLKGGVTLAGIYAKLYGDGFIFLGIRDGRLPSEPVDWDNIKGLDWVVVRSKYEVSFNYFDSTITNHGSGVNVNDIVDVDGEDVSIRGVKFHESRVYRFKGVSRHGTSLSRDHFNMSVIDGVYSDYQRYLAAIQNGADMLASHSIFKFGIQGLSTKALKQSTANALRRRFQSILDGIRTIGGLVYDSSSEQAEYINRSYSGVNDILEHLKQWLVGNSGLPQNKLFGSAAANALSSQSQGEEHQWNEIINRYRAMEVIPFYELVLKVLLYANNLEDKRYDCGAEFPKFSEITEKDIAETSQAKAASLKTLIEALALAQERGFMDEKEAKEILAKEI